MDSSFITGLAKFFHYRMHGNRDNISDGSVYEGEFRNGKLHDFGTLT